jgi:histo-blood group ABO system transferase
MKIGLLLIATGKYERFIEPLIISARRNFLHDEEVSYFLFTDSVEPYPECKVIPVTHRPWPYPTLMRYNIFYSHGHLFNGMDYLFYCDIDMLFVDEVGREVLGDRVAVQHPGYYGQRGTPETRPESLAYISTNVNMQYFAGGFNGGRTQEFLTMARLIDQNIQADLENGIIAIWHDESHLNRYFCDNPPTLILDPGYCYGESMKIPFKQRILALDKDHRRLRS